MFLQSIGLLPDNIIILSTSREKAELSVSDKLKKNFPNAPNINAMTKESVDQYDLNIKSVRAIFQGFFSEINAENKTQEATIEELAKILKFKKHTSGARKPPRLLLLGPPCIIIFIKIIFNIIRFKEI